MNNFILINITYTHTTSESAENGEFSEAGLIEDQVKVSFSELVTLMLNHSIASCSPNTYNINVYYHTDSYVYDYQKGIDRIEYISYSVFNTANCAKYWKWARIFAEQKYRKWVNELN